MTLRMKSGLLALSFSALCWAVLINASVQYLSGQSQGVDHVVTASTTIDATAETQQIEIRPNQLQTY